MHHWIYFPYCRFINYVSISKGGRGKKCWLLLMQGEGGFWNTEFSIFISKIWTNLWYLDRCSILTEMTEMYWWEKFSNIDKRTSTFIRNSRVPAIQKSWKQKKISRKQKNHAKFSLQCNKIPTVRRTDCCMFSQKGITIEEVKEGNPLFTVVIFHKLGKIGLQSLI